MVATAGAGPKPIPQKSLNGYNLAEAIKYCLTPQALNAADKIASKMRTESGIKAAVDSFHRHLPSEKLACDVLPDHPASWIYRKGKKQMKLSKLAAEVLIEQWRIERKDLKQ